MSEKINKNISKSASNFAPYFVDHQSLPDMNSNGYFVIKNNMSIPKKVINLYNSYTLGPYKYKYISYDMGFDSRSEFLFTNGSNGKNVISFGADMNSSLHIENKGKVILILGEERTQGLDDTTISSRSKMSH